MINENNYRGLEAEQLKLIKDYQHPNEISADSHHNLDFLYEITTTEIIEFRSQNEYTWLHIWLPFCPNDNCQNISVYQETAAKYQNLGFLMISATYDVNEIHEIKKRSKFTHPIYVIKNASYHHKQRKLIEMFMNELKVRKELHHVDDLIYKGDSLIYVGNEGTEYLDSLKRRTPLILAQ